MSSRLVVSDMRSLHACAAFLLPFCSFCGGSCLGLGAAEGPAGAEALVRQLRHSDYDVRRGAAEKLVALGEAARAALEEAALSEDVETRAAASLLLSRLETASITVLAFDRDGRPAAGAEAEVRVTAPRPGPGWNEQGGRSITVAADGTAGLSGLAPKETSLSLNWRKWSPFREGSAFLAASAGSWSPASRPLYLQRGSSPLFVTLARHGAVEVRAQDAEGRPLKDVRAQLCPCTMQLKGALLDMQLALADYWGRNAPAGASEADGCVRLDVAEGVYQCVVQASECLPALAGTVRVREGETVRVPAVSLVKRNSGKLSVTLLKADGSPVKKTQVSVALDYQYEGPDADSLQREARQLQRQLDMRRSPDRRQIEEDGKLLLEDLRPGRYKLVVVSGLEPPWLADVTVLAGQAAALPPLKPSLAGSIKGKVTFAGGKGLRFSSVVAVPEQDLASDDAAWQLLDWRYAMPRRFDSGGYSQTQDDGSYEVKGLPPGRYAVAVATRQGQPVLIYGVQVAAGKTSAAPDAVLPADSATLTQDLKGAVLLADGRPAQGANVTLYSRTGGSWNSNCDEKGAFQFAAPHEHGFASGYLVAKAAGSRPLCLDLAAPGLRLGGLSLRLEKQEYGSLRVKVVDEAGKALRGVTVSPRSQRYRARYMPSLMLDRENVTNRNGEVLLTGLATGERNLQVQCDGYYTSSDFRVAVLAEAETQATVILRQGLAISGRVVFPEGYGRAQRAAVAAAGTGTRRTSWADQEGRFSFAGLTPGEYLLSAWAPGLICADSATVALRADVQVQESLLKLVRPGGVAVAVGRRFEGCTATLAPKGSGSSLPLSRARGIRQDSGDGVVDAAGRVEFWGLLPGEYDLLLSTESAQDRNLHLYPYGATVRKSSVWLVGGPVQVRALQSVSELPALTGVELRLDPGAATVSGKLACPLPATEAGASPGTLNLKLVSTGAGGAISFSYPNELAPRLERPPLIIGAPPGGASCRLPAPGSFLFRNVPAGEYKLAVEWQPYGTPPKPALDDAASRPAPVLSSFTVQRGAQVDLGTLRYEAPADMPSPSGALENAQMSRWQAEAQPEDRVPLFQP